jgi:hypothetical protein
VCTPRREQRCSTATCSAVFTSFAAFSRGGDRASSRALPGGVSPPGTRAGAPVLDPRRPCQLHVQRSRIWSGATACPSAIARNRIRILQAVFLPRGRLNHERDEIVEVCAFHGWRRGRRGRSCVSVGSGFPPRR